jgi:hypothetical protein
MNVGQIATGFGLGVYGAAFYMVSRWYVRSDTRLRRTADSRWELDKLIVRQVRRGQVSKDEWFEKWIRSERAIVKWWFTPFVALWLVLCVVMVVDGFQAG